jgi:ABC-type nitrate/sulfonate/bicarbonate transport system substrate-binding protein
MKLRLLESRFLLLAVLASDPLLVHAAAPLSKVLITTGSASEREGALYVAQDQGYFRKYGVDVTLVQVRNGPVGMAALTSGESFMHWARSREPISARSPRARIWCLSPGLSTA